MIHPSYTPTTTWEAGAYLIHWSMGQIQVEEAVSNGRSLNSPTSITFAYYSPEAADYKLRELRGEVQIPEEKRRAYAGRR